nr:flagellar motor protein MotB [uncultured Cellulosilyticum sp.]
MKKKEDEPKKGAPAYMNTYGDMMTLLLTFFVLLFSMSTIDAAKFKAVIASFDGSIGILDGADTINENANILGNGVSQFPAPKSNLDLQQAAQLNEALIKLQKELQEYTSKEKIDDQLVIEKDGDEIIIRFAETLLFESGKAEIKAGAIPTLDALSPKLKECVGQGYTLRFEGHTDNRPIHTAQFPSNFELSGARAAAVARFYIEEMGFDPTKLSIEGMSEYHPIADNSTEEGRSKNRRVEIKIGKSLTAQ